MNNTTLRIATLADIASRFPESRYVWKDWIEGSGLTYVLGQQDQRTAFLIDLAWRLWVAEELPDGSGPVAPKRSRTLWIPEAGDEQRDAVIEAAVSFGVVPEAITFFETDEFEGEGRGDIPEFREAVKAEIKRQNYTLVVIDGVEDWSNLNLHKFHGGRNVTRPLLGIAEDTGASIVGLLDDRDRVLAPGHSSEIRILADQVGWKIAKTWGIHKPSSPIRATFGAEAVEYLA